MQVEGMHPWWDEEEEKRRAAAMKTREPEQPVNENSFYAGAVKGGIMGTLGNKKFETIKDYEKAIGETEKTIVDLSHQQYEHMMNGDQPKMDALTPMIGQALMARDQLRVEMGNQMGLGSDGWASQGKSYTGSYETQLKNKDEMTEFVKKVKEAEANIPGDQGMYGRNKGSAPIYEKVIPVTEIPTGQSSFDDPLPILEPYIIDPNKKREDIKEFLLSDVGDKSKPRGGGGFDNPLGVNGYGSNSIQFAANDCVPIMGLDNQEQEYIDSMAQTYGGMSEGLEAAQANTREAIVNSLSPELRSKADVYVGMGDTEPKVEDEVSESQSKEDRIAELESDIFLYYIDKAYMKPEDFDKKYMGGSIYSPQLFNTWKNELAELTSENYANDYVDGGYWGYKNNRLMFEEVCNNVTGKFEYDPDTHTLEYHGLFDSTDNDHREVNNGPVEDPLKNIDTEKLGFVNPKCDNCYMYQDENGIYYFGSSSKPMNLLMNVGAFNPLPFSNDIVRGINEKLSNIEYINGNATSLALDATGVITDIVDSPVTKVAGEVSEYIGLAVNLYNFGDGIVNNEAEITQVTECLFGSRIKSSTREGCMNKFLVYFNITKKAVEEGVITYKPWTGIMFRSDVEYDYDEFRDLIDATGIDFGDLQDYNK